MTPIRSCFLLLATFFLFFATVSHTYVNEKLLLTFNLSNEGDSFYALIDSKVNAKRVARKLLTLPGIARVVEIKTDEISHNITKILDTLEFSADVLALEGDYQGLKIVFTENLKERSQGLIQNYLSKLVGKDSITMGQILKNQASEFEGQLKNSIQTWGFQILYGLALMIWALAYFLWSTKAMSYGKILRRYSRSKGHDLGLFVWMVLFCFCLFIIFGLTMGNVAIVPLYIIMTLLALGMGGVRLARQ